MTPMSVHRGKLAAVFLLVFSVAGFALKAQDAAAQKLGLKACIEYSLKNHPSTRVFANDRQVAEQKAQEALAGYLPQINGTGTLDDNIKRQTTIIPAGAFSPTDLKVQFGNQYSIGAVLQADQTIYDQTLIAGLKANKPNKELADLKRLKNDDDLIYNTSSAYYQVLIYKEQEKLLAENEKKFSDILNVQKLQYEKGVIKKVDYDRVRVNLNNITSQRKQAQMNLDLSLNRLKNSMGMPLETALQIEDSVSTNPANLVGAQAQEYDVKNVLDFKIQDKNTFLLEIDLKRKRAANLPVLTAYGRYGAQAFGNEFDKTVNNWFDYSAVGLKLNVPIFSGFRRHSQIKQSEYALLSARENMKLTENTLRLNFQNSTTALSSSYNNLMNNQENLVLAKDVFDNTSLQYQKGSTTLTEFLNSDYAYKEAQSNYINSLLNYLIAKIDLERSKGSLKQYLTQLN